jgi:hypothetical protein
MLFRTRFHPAIRRGDIRCTYRRWKSPRVRIGGRYRLDARPVLIVTAIGEVAEASITNRAARDAGYLHRAELVDDLRSHADDAGYRLYRIEFRCEREDDPRAALAADDALADDEIDAIIGRLRRLDAASSHGAWTARTLALIEAHPATLAAKLASQMGRERLPFKTDVRKLKALGLTISLERGYRLSPRGETVLRRIHALEK